MCCRMKLFIPCLMLLALTSCEDDPFGCEEEAKKAVCGNAVGEGAEDCDGADLRGLDCEDLGFDEGTLSCNAQCTYNLAACTYINGPECGDGVKEGDEACDTGVACPTAGDTCSATCTCEPASTDECACEDATITADAECTWDDKEQCSGWYSAYCYEFCGGSFEGQCFTDCITGAAALSYESGSSSVTPDCTITITCP